MIQILSKVYYKKTVLTKNGRRVRRWFRLKEIPLSQIKFISENDLSNLTIGEVIVVKYNQKKRLAIITQYKSDILGRDWKLKDV